MFNVAIVRPNDYSVTPDDSLETVTAKASPFVELTSVSATDMMALVVEVTNMTPETFGDTCVFNESATDVYQFCYMSNKDNNQAETRKYNGIATTLMADSETKLYGSVVVIRSLINPDYTCQNGSVEMEQLMNHLYRSTHHLGVLLKADGGIEPYQFYKDPVHAVDDPTQLTYTEEKMFGFHLYMFLWMDADENNTNYNGSVLLGKRRLVGDVIVTSIKNKTHYDQLTVEQVEQILKLATGPLDTRELTEEEQIRGKRNDEGLPYAINGHHVLTRRLLQKVDVRKLLFPPGPSLNKRMRDHLAESNRPKEEVESIE